MEKSTAVIQGSSVKKLLDSMIGASLIVFPFLKNSYRPVSLSGCSIIMPRIGGGWVSAFFVMLRDRKQVR